MEFVIGGMVLLAVVAALAARRNRGGTARWRRDHGDHAEAHLYAHLHAQQTHTTGPF